MAYEIKIHLIVIFLCTGQLTTAVGAEMRFILSRSTGDWAQAHQSCHRARGTLAVLNSKQLQLIFNTQVLPSPGERLWVGRYIGYTDPVWIQGCYQNVTLGAAGREVHVLADNYLVTCLNVCRRSPYIGMQGNHCYCLPDVPPSAPPVPGIHCQSACPGESVVDGPGQQMSHCGRTEARYNTVSVYRRVRAGEVTMAPGAANYGGCITYDARARAWSPGNCTQTLMYTCDRAPCSDVQPGACVLASQQPDTWFGARTKCEGNGGHVATVNTTTSIYFSSRPGAGPGPFWTGLHRQQKVQWSAGEDNPNLSRSDRCVALYKAEAGPWQWEVNPCTNPYRFVCIQDYTPPTTPAPWTPPPRRTNPQQQVSPSAGSGTTTPARPTVNPYAAPVNVTAGTESLHHGVWSFRVVSLVTTLSALVSVVMVLV